MDQDRNIFETAAKKFGKKGKKKDKKAPRPDPLKPNENKATAEEANLPFAPPKPNADPEIKEMLDKIHAMRVDIHTKLENLYKRSGMSREALLIFISNPKNFSTKDWDFIQENKFHLESKVWSTIGEELKPQTTPVRENLAGDRKGKNTRCA